MCCLSLSSERRRPGKRRAIRHCAKEFERHSKSTTRTIVSKTKTKTMTKRKAKRKNKRADLKGKYLSCPKQSSSCATGRRRENGSSLFSDLKRCDNDIRTIQSQRTLKISNSISFLGNNYSNNNKNNNDAFCKRSYGTSHKMNKCQITTMIPIVSSVVTNRVKLSFPATLSTVSSNYVPTVSDLHLLPKMVQEQTQLPVHRVVKHAMLSKW